MREIFHLLMSWNGTPPLIYIEGSHPLLYRDLSMGLLEPTLWANGEVTRRSLKAVGLMGWTADHPTGPTDLVFLWLGCSLGPLVNGVCLDSIYIGFLLWWAFRSMWISCDGVWSDDVLLLSWKGYDCHLFPAKTFTHRNLEGHVEFGDLFVAWV